MLLVFVYLLSQSVSNEIIFKFYGSEIIFEFILGFLIFFVWKLGMLSKIPAVFCLLFSFAAYGAMAYVEIYGYQNPRSYNFVSAFILVSCVIALESKFQGYDLLTRILANLGDASYSTYLSHWFVIVAMRKIVDPLLNWFDFHSLFGIIVTVTAALLVGQIIYLIVDKPLHNYSKNRLLKFLN
jgi:peptidoglycan/LPS O-acetylase OafA/YrhL